MGRVMKRSLILFTVLTYGLSGSVAYAEPNSSACESAKEKAEKGKQLLQVRQEAVQLAQAETRLAYSKLVECRPGAIFTAGRAQRCAYAQSQVPLRVQQQTDAENLMHQALVEYEETVEWVNQACVSKESAVAQKDLLDRMTSIEAEIIELKAIIRGLNKK